MKKLVTHDNGFHADDVMAYAILKEVLTKQGEQWTITRTRDESIIAAADIVFDKGFIYDPTTNRYDHHQQGRAGARPNGILYAACGLIWKHFGRIIAPTDFVWNEIDQGIVSGIDAADNGQDPVKDYNFENFNPHTITNAIADFESTMFEEKNQETLLQNFEQASEFARGILKRAIHVAESLERAMLEVTEVYNLADDKQILVFSKNYTRLTWHQLATFPEPVFIVYPNEFNNTWKVEAVTKNLLTKESRKYFPESWRGLRGDELATITDVSDARFCHPSGFLIGADSKESALKLAKMALLM